MQVDFSFNSRVRSVSTLSHPSYSVSISNLLGVPCAVSLNAFQPLKSTWGGGSGSSVTWTCESTLGTGSWNQSWTGLPSVVGGSHIIAGSWGDWTMVVTSASLNFAGVIELTVSPFDVLPRAQCDTTGITSLSMVGAMVFQDPEMPGSVAELDPKLLRLLRSKDPGSAAAACPGLAAILGAGDPPVAKADQNGIFECDHDMGPVRE